jgi:hypothetical protein
MTSIAPTLVSDLLWHHNTKARVVVGISIHCWNAITAASVVDDVDNSWHLSIDKSSPDLVLPLYVVKSVLPTTDTRFNSRETIATTECLLLGTNNN